jgi:hypothetical protein
MATQAQVLANQANAQLSTGPKTEEGKNKSKLNAWRHGLTGQTVIMPQEDLKAYLAFREEQLAELEPANAIESQIAQRIINIQWRSDRCFMLEMAVYALGHNESPGNVPCSDGQIHATITAAGVLRDQTDAIKVLGMHEQRLARMYERAKAELTALQAARKESNRRQWAAAAEVRKHQQTLRQNWDPAANGFDFSAAELDQWITRQDMFDAASIAAMSHRHRATIGR